MMKSIGNLFTPRIRSGDGWKRLRFFISNEDDKKIHRGKRWKATITDINTGKRYKTRGGSCGSPECFCDAIVEEVI